MGEKLPLRNNEIKNDTKSMEQSMWKKLFPTGYRREFLGFIELYVPIVFTNAFKFLNPMVSVMMCGHLSNNELAAATLANSIIFMLGLSVDLGFSTSFDTLFAQIYGSGQKEKMGLLLQKAVIVITLLYLVLACIHLNIEPILILLKQDPFISELTSQYLTIYLPGLFFEFQFLTMSRYLQAQNIVMPMMLAAFLGNIFNSVGQYIAIFVLGYKMNASAFFQSIANIVMFSVQLGCVLIRRLVKETWQEISIKIAIINWKIIFALGIPGMFMLGLALWSIEASTFIAGSLGVIQLGAQSVAFQCCYFTYMMTTGMGCAVTIRVGQYLGARQIDRLKTFLRTVLTIGMCTSTVNFIILFSLRKEISSLFSKDLEIQKEASFLLILVALIQFLDVAIVVTSGVLKASGRQLSAAIVMFICYYIIGNPIGLVLVYVVKLQIKGMWMGLLTALFLESLIFSILVYRTNWERECDKATTNIGSFDCDVAKEIEEQNDDFHDFKKIVVIRTITLFIVLTLFISSICIHIYLPKTLYLPCIQITNQTLEIYKRSSELLCAP